MESEVFEHVGGEEGVRAWMEKFYRNVGENPLLAPLFPEDLSESINKQTAYMIEFLGGPPRYSETYGKAFLRFKHRHLKIGIPERDAWMEAMRASLVESVTDEKLIEGIMKHLTPIANAMVNHNPQKKDAYYFN